MDRYLSLILIEISLKELVISLLELEISLILIEISLKRIRDRYISRIEFRIGTYL
jgi:hypothetical protein